MLNKKGFTLMEILIAASIFAMLASMASILFVNITNAEKKTELLNSLYEDSRVIMETLSREVKNGTVDYEEYYSTSVLASSYYGVNRGVYASQFYDPGYYIDEEDIVQKGENPADLGIQIFDDVIFTLSADQNLGKNPYNADPTTASAFCESATCALEQDPLKQKELYLISADGRTKTILGRKSIVSTGDYALVMLQMEGLDKDSNGVVDIFTCAPEYSSGCKNAPDIKSIPAIDLTGIKIPSVLRGDEAALSILESPFIPLSPLRSSIKDIKFMIWPAEDPYKAFAELDTQFQPSVTIIMTIEPSAAEKERYPGDAPEITLQTTVSAGVKGKITTYPPTKDLSWIEGAL